MKKGKLGWVLAILAAGVCGLGGCGISPKAKDFFKAIESKSYDYAAMGGSYYCQGIGTDILNGTSAEFLAQERIEARREIRQRGKHGPVIASVDGLDPKTAQAKGPIIRVYCEGDVVPEAVVQDLVRNRKN